MTNDEDAVAWKEPENYIFIRKGGQTIRLTLTAFCEKKRKRGCSRRESVQTEVSGKQEDTNEKRTRKRKSVSSRNCTVCAVYKRESQPFEEEEKQEFYEEIENTAEDQVLDEVHRSQGS